ncbi:glycosyltransferase family 4 protein [Stenotrophomonas maltophilia]|uniref:glycosyltransferase family 4 protein n=1 Tax=Stenotrophomonas maltophilia TaxID=40324 RepID=UPI003019DF57
MRALVVQRRMTHYRISFFEALRMSLLDRGIELTLAHGDASGGELAKKDSASLPWAERLSTNYFMNGRVCWQPFGSLAQDNDIIVVTHENKLLYNLVAQYSLPRSKRVVLWGHGANLQGKSKSAAERLKKFTAKKADWWLAYTSHSVPLIEKSGFPSERITVLNNTIDTTLLAESIANTDDDLISEFRRVHAISAGPIGLYLGSLYSEKRIPFLIASALKIKDRVPNFSLVIAGAGPEEHLARLSAKNYPWIHFIGPVRDRQKSTALAAARVILNPGLVGLGILDSFVSGTPMLTTDCGLHSPEIAYLEHGVNGLMTADDMDEFVLAACEVISDDRMYESISLNAKKLSTDLTITAMAENFSTALHSCLAQPSFR